MKDVSAEKFQSDATVIDLFASNEKVVISFTKISINLKDFYSVTPINYLDY